MLAPSLNTTENFGMVVQRFSILCLFAFLSGCGGGGGGEDAPVVPNPNSGIPTAPTTGTGRLTVTVHNAHRRPLENAGVWLHGAGPVRVVLTARNGTASFDSLPGVVDVSVLHSLGKAFSGSQIVVAQQGETNLDVVLETYLPRPTVALMPVEIVAGSVSADRRELALHVKMVASPKGDLSNYLEGWGGVVTYVGLALEAGPFDTQRDCHLIYDSRNVPPFECSTWGDPVHAVTATEFSYDLQSRAPLQADPVAAPSTMLLVDQSQRMAQFTYAAARSFAVRQLSDRLIRDAASPRALAIAGFAGLAGGASSPPSLPSLPLWLPRGAGSAFSGDPIIFESGIDMLEPLTGGISPVFEALEAAVRITVDAAPAGGGTVVAVITGDDQTNLTASQRAAKLSALRQQHLDSGVQTIIIAAAIPDEIAGNTTVAEMAEALGAPLISTGLIDFRHDDTTPGQGLYAALDLAADLLTGGDMPTVSATFRVRARAAGAFVAGAMLRGVLFLQSDICPVGCQELSLPFAVRIP
jgi:hypothetical protein